jgi:hypothetical protein
LAPRLAAGPGGSVVLSWLEPDGEDHLLKFAAWTGEGWGPAGTVARGADWAVSQADLPAVVPIDGATWVAHWLVTSPAGFFAYDIAVARSADGGRSWSAPVLLNDDGTPTEHGFVSWFAWAGAIGAIWLDGRNLAAEPTDEEPAASPVGTSLRFARLGFNGGVLEQGVIDELVCDCCHTGAAVSAAGPVVTYRDRTPEERRDVVVRQHVDGAWSEVVELGPDDWIIEGCPVNGPAAAALGEDVAVAWFTAPQNRPKVRLARSSDGGATFRPAVDLDGAGAFGHVGVALLDRDTAAASWWRMGAPGSIDLVVQTVGSDGEPGARMTVGSAVAARPADVPQLAAAGRRLLLAWTDANAGSIRTASLDLD